MSRARPGENAFVKAARERREAATPEPETRSSLPEPAPTVESAPASASTPRRPGRPAKLPRAGVSVEPSRMLGGRVPDSVFRRFSRLKEDAELELGVRKITNEQGLEAMVRALEDPEVRAAWFRALDAAHGDGR